MAKIEALKKITVKNIMKGKPARDKEGNVITKRLCLIYGACRGYQEKSTDFGPYNEFIGRFEAKNLDSGDIAQSTRFIGPDIASDLLANAMAEAGADAMVEFAFIVGVESRDDLPIGYSFTVEPVADQAAVNKDPLSNLREMLNAEQPELMAIGAPPAAAQIENKTAETVDPKTGEVKEPKK